MFCLFLFLPLLLIMHAFYLLFLLLSDISFILPSYHSAFAITWHNILYKFLWNYTWKGYRFEILKTRCDSRNKRSYRMLQVFPHRLPLNHFLPKADLTDSNSALKVHYLLYLMWYYENMNTYNNIIQNIYMYVRAYDEMKWNDENSIWETKEAETKL